MSENEVIATQPIGADEAMVGVTWDGNFGNFRDPVNFQAPDAQILSFVTEAVRTGSVPGIPADPAANFDGFVVERFAATPDRNFNVIQVRPKTPFGV